MNLALPVDEDQLKRNIETVALNVRAAAERSGRKYEDIKILAATKTQNAEMINRAISYGIRYIGENRVQELTEKYDAYDKENASVHFIGRLQTNKVKYLADKVDMIHSVDSVKLAAEIDRNCEKLDKVMNVLAEVNVGGEAAKGGVEVPRLEQFLSDISHFQHIHVCGLMTIPPPCDANRVRNYFSILTKEFLDIGAKKLDNINMEFLSMGMSGDYAYAVECGANIVRVGTAIFGLRKN